MSRYYIFAVLALLWSATATSSAAQSSPASTSEHLSGQTHAAAVASLSRAQLANSVRLNSVRKREWNSAEWIDASRTEYLYESGRRSERLTHGSTEAGFVPVSRTTYLHDGAGRLIIETEYLWDPVAEDYVPESQVRSLYVGGHTVPSEVTDLEWNDSAARFSPVEKQTFVVVEQGERSLIVGGERYEMTSGEGNALDRFTVEEVGPDVVYTSDFVMEGEWVHESRTIYHDISLAEFYDRFVQLLSDLEDLEDSMILLVHLPDGLTELWNGSDWEDASRQVTIYEYDAFTGAISASTTLHQAFDEGEWTTEMRIDLGYELVGLSSRPEVLTLRIPLDESEDFLDIHREFYAYHSSGHVSNVEMHSVDWLGGLAPRLWIAYEWGETGTSIDREEIAASFALEPAYPNPFNPTTTIPFTLDRPAHVQMTIYDAAGREVETFSARPYLQGRHAVMFDATRLASGTYFVRLSVEGHSATRAITLMK